MCLLLMLIIFTSPALARAEQVVPTQRNATARSDITIIRQGDKTVQEYRLNGKLYKIKITPDQGPPYYLIDVNGNGTLDVRANNLDGGLKVPQWVLLSW